MDIEFTVDWPNPLYDQIPRCWWDCYPRIPVPEPFQAGVEDPWVVYIPSGRWAVHKPIRICPLEFPTELRGGDLVMPARVSGIP